MGTNVRNVISSQSVNQVKFNPGENFSSVSSVLSGKTGGCVSVGIDSVSGGCALLDKKAQLSPVDRLQKRARSKFISDPLKRGLMRLESPLFKSYYGSCLCCSELAQNDKKITSKYCNARWCITCNRIRTAKMIGGYYAQFEQMDQLYFGTLTVPNVKAEDLPGMLDLMYHEWSNIRKYANKNKIDLGDGIRKIECTHNVSRDDYHPHFHLLINSREAAEFIVSRWLVRFPQAKPWCQDIREVDKRHNSLMELFKYSTKLIMKVSDTAEQSGLPIDEELVEYDSDGVFMDFDFRNPVHFKALDIIFQAMVGRRVYQPFGNIKKVSEDIDQLSSEEIEELIPSTQFYSWYKNDWILVNMDLGTISPSVFVNSPDWDTGEIIVGLSGYVPSVKDVKLVELMEHG